MALYRWPKNSSRASKCPVSSPSPTFLQSALSCSSQQHLFPRNSARVLWSRGHSNTRWCPVGDLLNLVVLKWAKHGDWQWAFIHVVGTPTVDAAVSDEGFLLFPPCSVTRPGKKDGRRIVYLGGLDFLTYMITNQAASSSLYREYTLFSENAPQEDSYKRSHAFCCPCSVPIRV